MGQFPRLSLICVRETDPVCQLFHVSVTWPFLLTNTDGQCAECVVRAGLITTVTATSIVCSTERKATWSAVVRECRER
jgi:hypothetical protein